MMIKHSLISLILAGSMTFTLFSGNVSASNNSAGLDNFIEDNTFKADTFTDVSESDWFYGEVKAAYQYGLMKGNSETTFNPHGSITVAEAVTIASRIHSIYHTGEANFENASPWYAAYVEYALDNGILSEPHPNYWGVATRAECAGILAKALPDEILPKINGVADNAIPDVKISDTYGEDIYKLYRAGILAGNDNVGTFSPRSDIKRSEVAAIVTRLLDSSLRKSTPDSLARQPIKDEDIEISSWKSYTEENVYKDYSNTTEGDFSYCITSDVPNDLRIVKTFSVKPNTQYVVSADVKTENVVKAEDSSRNIGANISVGNYNNSKSLFGTADWTNIRMAVKSDEDGKVTVSMNLGYWSSTCTGKVWFDNIRCTEITEFSDGLRDNTWKFLAVILPSTSIDNENIKKSHRMSESSIDKIKNCMPLLEEDFKTISHGKINAEFDVVVSEGLLSDYIPYGSDSYHINGSKAYEYCKENNIDITGYDHVYFITCLSGISNAYMGLGGNPIDGYTGFSFIVYDTEDQINELTANTWYWSSSVYVHEFLHSIETYSKKLGFDTYLIHDAEMYGYKNVRDWYDFYEDYIGKNISYNNKKIGVNPAIWNLPPHVFN